GRFDLLSVRRAVVEPQVKILTVAGRERVRVQRLSAELNGHDLLTAPPAEPRRAYAHDGRAGGDKPHIGLRGQTRRFAPDRDGPRGGRAPAAPNQVVPRGRGGRGPRFDRQRTGRGIAHPHDEVHGSGVRLRAAQVEKRPGDGRGEHVHLRDRRADGYGGER